MLRALTALFPGLPDLLIWAAARRRPALPAIVVAALVCAVTLAALAPARTWAIIRSAGRSPGVIGRRRDRVRQQTDSLYPLW